MSNNVTLVGNLTREPELKYTPSGAAVAKFGDVPRFPGAALS
jgi:single-stranded DNA-binding protein